MSISAQKDSDLTSLRGDIAALKHDVANLLEHSKASLTQAARGAVPRVDDALRGLYRGANTQAERASKSIGGQVQTHPLASLLIALGVGYIGERVLTR